jgi:hypothetical protein
MCELSDKYGLDSSLIKPRVKELVGMVPRPYRAGLNVELSKKLGLLQYSYMDGFVEMQGTNQ